MVKKDKSTALGMLKAGCSFVEVAEALGIDSKEVLAWWKKEKEVTNNDIRKENKMLKLFKGWKTITFSILSLIVGLLAVLDEFNVIEFVPDNLTVYYVVFSALMTFGLRLVTTSPIGKKF